MSNNPSAPAPPTRLGTRPTYVGMAWIACVALGLGLERGAADEPPPKIVLEVSAGAHHRDQSLVAWELPAEYRDVPHWALRREDNGQLVPVQRIAESPARLVFMLDEPLAPQSHRRYQLVPRDTPEDSPSPSVSVADNGRDLQLMVQGKVVLNYHHAKQASPDGVDPRYGRSGYIHPLLTPSGRVVTGDFAPDHPHQHGLFLAWVNTTYQGHAVDFWNQLAETGRVDHARILALRQGPVFADMAVELRHMDTTNTTQPHVVLNERWVVRTYRTTGHYVVDLQSALQAVDAPLTIHAYHYGGLGIRGASSWFAGDTPDFSFTTSEGLDRQQGNHSRPHWVSMSGTVAGGQASVTAFGSPTNFRFPQPVRLHPTKPYFCFAPMVLGEFTLNPTALYYSQYRLVTQDGPVDVSQNQRIWYDLVEPVQVRCVSKPTQPERKPVPDKLVVLTFDDSVKSQFTVVRPLLQQYGFGATFFITEGFDFRENKRDYMTWEEISQLHRDGFEIGNHTRDHLGITDDNVDRLREQLEGIAQQCAQWGIPRPVTFAWPGNALSLKALPILREHGIRWARRGGAPEFPYPEGRGWAFEPGADHPLLIPSAGDSRPNWTMEDFQRAVAQARDGRIAVLQFHGAPDTAHAWVNTPEHQFADYMRYLAHEKYHVIALRDVDRYVDPDQVPADPLAVVKRRTAP